MKSMPDQQSEGDQPKRGRGRWVKRGGVALLMIGIIGAAFYIFALPRIGQWIVRGALDGYGLSDAGFELRQLTAGRLVLADVTLGDSPPSRIERIDATFSIRQRRAQRIDVIGMQLHAQQTDDGWQIAALDKLDLGEGSGSSADALPFDSLRLRSSTLVLSMKGDELRIPIEADFDASTTPWRVRTTLWPNGSAVVIEGEVSPPTSDSVQQYGFVARLELSDPGALMRLADVDVADLKGMGPAIVALRGSASADGAVAIDDGSLQWGEREGDSLAVVRLPGSQPVRLSGVAGEVKFAGKRAATGDVSIAIDAGAFLRVNGVTSPGAGWQVDATDSVADDDRASLLEARLESPLTFERDSSSAEAWLATCDRIVIAGGADRIRVADGKFVGSSASLDVAASLHANAEGARVSLLTPVAIKLAQAQLADGITADDIRIKVDAQSDVPAVAVQWTALDDWRAALSVAADIAAVNMADQSVRVQGIHASTSALAVTRDGVVADADLSVAAVHLLDQQWPGPSARLQVKGERFVVQAAWSDGQGVDLDAAGELALTAQGIAGRIELEPVAIELADAELLSRVVPASLDLQASGRVTLSGDVVLDAGGVHPTLRVQSAGVAVNVGELNLAVEGLDVDLTFAGLSPVTSVGRQSISIARLVLGDEEAQIDYRDLYANFSLEPGNVVLIDRLRLTAGELARLTFRSFRVPLDLTKLEFVDLLVYAEDVSVSELARLTKMHEYLKAGGTMYGRVPVRLRLQDGAFSSFAVGEGFLYGEPGGGTVAIHDEKILGYLTQGLVLEDVRKRVREALQDFAYAQLRLDFVKVRREGRDVIDCKVTIAGSGPRDSTRPVPITVNPNVFDVNSFLTDVMGLTELMRVQTILQDRIKAALERSADGPDPPTQR